MTNQVKDQLAEDATAALAAGLSYGKYKALQRENMLPHAVPATETGVKRLKSEQEENRLQEQLNIKECEEIKKKLEKLNLKFKVKTGKTDQVFGSVSTKAIADELKQNGYAIDKRKIRLENPLASLGFHEVEIELHKEVIAKIKVQLTK